MPPIRRGGGNQPLHRKSESYRQAVRRKLAAYERHIPLGLLAQGLMVYLAVRVRCGCGFCANHYLRTVKRYRSPSESGVRYALRNTWADALALSPLAVPLPKFLASKLAPHYRGILEPSNLEAAA